MSRLCGVCLLSRLKWGIIHIAMVNILFGILKKSPNVNESSFLEIGDISRNKLSYEIDPQNGDCH